MSERTARLTFALAGIYGLIVLVPFFFLERWIAQAAPGGLPHAEYYYGFLGAASVMQLVYLTIARDPVRFRPLMPLCALAKTAFFLPVLILWAQAPDSGGRARIRLDRRFARRRLHPRLAGDAGGALAAAGRLVRWPGVHSRAYRDRRAHASASTSVGGRRKVMAAASGPPSRRCFAPDRCPAGRSADRAGRR